MTTNRLAPIFFASLLAACGGGDEADRSTSAGGTAASELRATATDAQSSKEIAAPRDSLVAPLYVLDFVAPGAIGYDLNDKGDVVGKAAIDTGCGPFCLPVQQAVLWKGSERIVLPPPPGVDAASTYPRYLNNLGTIAGVSGLVGSSTRATVWKPEGTGYVAQDLGVFPRTSSVDVFGIDDQDRLVGWGTMGGAIPTYAVPFGWSPTTGMVDLKALGYPNERPAAMSRGGKVVTWGSWYQLGDPASTKALPPLPYGFLGAGSNGSAINDFGDQAHFLVSISTQSLVYPFRLSADGTWQQISTMGTGRMSRAGMGSISAAQDVSFTALGTGMVAVGPAGVGAPLAPRISAAYPGATVGDAGVMNSSGQILAQVMIGRSLRLVKLTPASACTSDCLVSRSLTLSGQFAQVPTGSCQPGQSNTGSASTTITDENGTPLPNVLVNGRFLDDYLTNRVVSGTTNASGVVSWSHTAPCGVGAIAFIVEGASLGTRSFDRTRGTLAASTIPAGTTQPAPAPSNTAPVAIASITCTAGRTCTFDGSASHDPDGSVAAWRWSDSRGAVWSTQPAFTRTFNKAGKDSVLLRVTDNAGLSSTQKLSFTILR